MIQDRANSKIVFESDTVTKSFKSDVELEFEKSLALWKIGLKSGFSYPKPLEIDVKSDSIKFERIHNCRSIRNDYLKFMTQTNADSSLGNVVRQAGRVLAAIHRDLTLSRKDVWEPSARFIKAARKAGCCDFESRYPTLPHVFVHGDYGFENIERIGLPKPPQLVVFDASPNYFSTFSTRTYGPIYIDIGNFLSVLEGMVPLKNYPYFKWKRVKDLQLAFTDGYSEIWGSRCDLEIARVFSYASASCYMQKKYPKWHLHDIALLLLFGRLKKVNLK